jgi:hypothetical protein
LGIVQLKRKVAQHVLAQFLEKKLSLALEEDTQEKPYRKQKRAQNCHIEEPWPSNTSQGRRIQT